MHARTTVAHAVRLFLRGVSEAAALNSWGGESHELGSLFSQVRSTMLVTIFVFMDIEGARVYSRYAKNHDGVGVTTVQGFVGVLCLLMRITMLSYGILLRPELAALRPPRPWREYWKLWSARGVLFLSAWA